MLLVARSVAEEDQRVAEAGPLLMPLVAPPVAGVVVAGR